MDNEKLILRDYLALDRTVLANQRTFLSFLRTTLYFIVSAVALFNVQVLEDVKWIGWVLIILSVLTIAFGTYNYKKFKRKIDNNYE